MSASTSAQPASATTTQYRPAMSRPSKLAIAEGYRRAAAFRAHRAGTTQGPGARERKLRGPESFGMDQRVFLAGTAFGSLRRAVRARVTRAVVALAGAFLAAGVVCFATLLDAARFAGFGSADSTVFFAVWAA